MKQINECLDSYKRLSPNDKQIFQHLFKKIPFTKKDIVKPKDVKYFLKKHTQRYLAGLIGVDPRTLSSWLLGSRGLPFKYQINLYKLGD